MTDPELPVLVLVDHADGLPRGTALELLTAARDLGEVHAVWIGDAADDAAGRLGEFGAAVVHVVPVAEPAASLPPAVAAAVVGVMGAVGAGALLLASTFENKEVAARVALAVGAGLVVDASFRFKIHESMLLLDEIYHFPMNRRI